MSTIHSYTNLERVLHRSLKEVGYQYRNVAFLARFRLIGFSERPLHMLFARGLFCLTLVHSGILYATLLLIYNMQIYPRLFLFKF